MGHDIVMAVGQRPDLKRRPVVVHCGRCSYEWAIGFAPMAVTQFTTVARRARCARCRSKEPVMMGWAPGHLGKNAWEWIFSGQTGSSSLTIWSVLMGETPPDPAMDGADEDFRAGNTPMDAHDFRRCARLVALEPTWRLRLPEVAARFPAWGPLINEWDGLVIQLDELDAMRRDDPGLEGVFRMLSDRVYRLGHNGASR